MLRFATSSEMRERLGRGLGQGSAPVEGGDDRKCVRHAGYLHYGPHYEKTREILGAFLWDDTDHNR